MREPTLIFSAFVLAHFGFLTLPAHGESPPTTAAYTWTTLAGYPGIGSADGVGSMAEFYNPSGLAVDTAGNIFVADTFNYVIRKIAPSGLVSTIAGVAGVPGASDGTNQAARFTSPQAMTMDLAGNFFVLDAGAIRKITPQGADWAVSTIIGSGLLINPQGIAADTNGCLFVANTETLTIMKITPAGTNWIASTIAGQAGSEGATDGTNSDARFNYPWGIAVDGSGNVYVTDSVRFSAHADKAGDTIRKITPDATGSNWVVCTLAGLAGAWGTSNGVGTNALFDGPAGIAVDAQTNLYIADRFNNTIRKMTPVGTNWLVSTTAGSAGVSGSANGTGTNALFYSPLAVATDAAGNAYVAEPYNNTIRKVSAAGVVTPIAGSAGSAGSSDGTGSTARFRSPTGLALDRLGNIYVADSGNETIRLITAGGQVSTLAGTVTNSGSADDVGGNAQFSGPTSIALDSAGSLYIADMFNDTIRALTPAGIVSTIAGSAGQYGGADGIGTNAQFFWPYGITIDSNNNLYVADNQNNVIRQIVPSGSNWMVVTLAGFTNKLGGSADGTNADARFFLPTGITLDNTGSLYVSDSGNATIRQVSPLGSNWVVTTIAGSPGNPGYRDGIGTNALFWKPLGLVVDGAGDLYVADAGESLIRKVTRLGTNWAVSTIGGAAGSLGSVDGAGSAARFNGPGGIAVDNVGNVYVADTGNNTIRKGIFSAYTTANPMPYTPPETNGQLKVFLLASGTDGQAPFPDGQWRFAWELGWRTNGEVVSNLTQGPYDLQFRSLPGWLAFPQSLSGVSVQSGQMQSVTNYYYPTVNPDDLGTNDSASLKVTINANENPPAGAGWRFLGDTIPFPAYGSDYATNLLPGTYLIEFAPVTNYSKPPNLSVQVSAGQLTHVVVSYSLAQPVPTWNGSPVELPTPAPTNSIPDTTQFPFGFIGQLLTDAGEGSGVAVQPNVVLTAAHLVFNDQTRSYVNHAYWLPQETGVFSPVPQAAQAIYLLSGYAAQRTNDLTGGHFGPGDSSPQSRNLDVAVLYFSFPVVGGGYSGYLPSDAIPNSWLTSTSLKMLAGYPVDASVFGDSGIVPGLMYQTQPQPYPLSLATDLVADQQVYLAPWFLSYPGNSGGPFFVQFNGYFYPAGVYLGTLYDGAVPYASLVRGIDSNVVNMITLAQNLGINGTNSTGGGVITFVPTQLSANNPALVQVLLGPPAAVQAGASWGLAGDTSFAPYANNLTRAIITNDSSLIFKQLNGWNEPAPQTLQIHEGQINVISNVNYTVMPPLLFFTSSNSLALSGTPGTTYRLEYRTNLSVGQWMPLQTSTLLLGTNVLTGFSLNDTPAAFYRAVWIP